MFMPACKLIGWHNFLNNYVVPSSCLLVLRLKHCRLRDINAHFPEAENFPHWTKHVSRSAMKDTVTSYSKLVVLIFAQGGHKCYIFV